MFAIILQNFYLLPHLSRRLIYPIKLVLDSLKFSIILSRL